MRQPWFCNVLKAAAAMLLAGSAIGATAWGQPTLSGTVSNAQTGFGLVGIDLDVFDSNGASVTITGGVSGLGGAFTLVLPGAGTYTVRADASLASGFADEYYNNVFLPSQATPVTAQAASAITGINFSLALGRTISGRVTSAGAPLAGIDIDVYVQGPASRESLSGYPATTDANGNFTVGALPAGSYFIRANPDPALGQFYVTTYYGGSAVLSQAAPIVVGGTNLAGIDIDCAAGGLITGNVAAQAGGAPLAGLDLDLYDSLGARVSIQAATDINGDYQLGPVAAGNYFLRVDPTIAQGYPRTYYQVSYNISAATPIAVAAGGTANNIDFSLPRAGTISGAVTDALNASPLAQIDLDCYDSAGNRVDLDANSSIDGTYQIGPLAPGTYRLRAQPGAMQGYLVEYWNDKPDVATSDLITVTSNVDTGGINFGLGRAGWIQGTVRNAQAQPLAGIDLDIYDAVTGLRLTDSATSLADGTYLFGPIAVGSYKLRCDPSLAQGLAVEYYNGKPTLALADPVPVAAGQGTLGVDFTLEPGGVISGQVRALQGNAPIAGIDLDVFRQSDFLRMDQGAISGATGLYAVGPLPVGTYIIRAQPGAGFPYALTYYQNVAVPEQAQPISVGGGQNVGGIDLILPARTPVATLIRAYLLGLNLDPTGLDVNADGRIDVADLILAVRQGL